MLNLMGHVDKRNLKLYIIIVLRNVYKRYKLYTMFV